MIKDDKALDIFGEDDVALLINEESRGQSSFLKLLAWVDKFYGAYIRLGEKSDKLTPEIKADAKRAKSNLRRMALGHHLLLFSYHLNQDIMMKEKESFARNTELQDNTSSGAVKSDR